MKRIRSIAATLPLFVVSLAFAGDLDDAKALQQAGKFEEALPKYEAAAKADPTDPDAALGLSQVLTGLGRYDDAAKAVDAARKAHPENAALPAAKARANFVALAKAEAADDRDDSAIEMYKSAAEKWAMEALKVDPKNVEGLLVRGRLWMKDGEISEQDKDNEQAKARYDSAKPFFEQASAADPKNFDAVYDMANCLFRLAQLDNANMETWAKAETAFVTATRLDPKSAAAALNLAKCKGWQKEPPKEVAAAYVKALDLAPNDEKVLAGVFTWTPQADKVDTFKRLAESLPTSLMRKLYLASAYSQAKQFDKAVETLDAAEKLDPKNGDVPLNIGDVQIAAGRFDEALAAYERAFPLFHGTIIDPTFVRLGYTIGVQKKELKMEQKERLWTALWKNFPAHPALWNDLGLLYRDSWKDYKKSLEWYLRAAAAAPEDVCILNDTGLIFHYHMDDFAKAMPYYKKAIALGKERGYDDNSGKDPDRGYRDAMDNVAKILAKEKKWSELKEFVEKDMPENHAGRSGWLKAAEEKK